MDLTQLAEDRERGTADYAAFVDKVPAAALALVARNGSTVVTPSWLVLGDRAQAADLIDALEELARAAGSTAIVVDTVDELLRHEARGRGYEGNLRRPLRRRLAAPDATSAVDAASAPDDFASAVGALVPDLTIDVRARGVSRLTRSKPRMVDVVATHPSLARPLTVRMPNRPDAIPEAVAEVLDTAIGVLRRFPVDILRISCETASYDLASGQHAGETHPNVGMVYLNRSYLLADDLERMQRSWVERRPGVRRAELVPAPYSRIDGITAHEMWHRIENAHHQADWIAVHRALGVELGVETLEQALRGGAKGAPPAWRHAHRRVVDEVSQYATTNALEAKAEMFMQWWCRSASPSPLVARFGELIGAALPAGGRA